MKRVGKFEKVSLNQYYKDYIITHKGMNINEIKIEEIYNQILLPKRSTKGSAGYDFFAPEDITIPPHDSIVIPTGTRCQMEDGYVLVGFPRSGLGFKYRITLENTAAIIDSDYYNSDNEGHIMIKLHNPKDNPVNIEAGKGFSQGIFINYYITYDDETETIRNGGFGSTTKR